MNFTTTAASELIDAECTADSDKFFSSEEIAKLDLALTPKHVAIIPDGNRRWAMNQDASSTQGHQQGADIIIDVVKAAKELGIETVTFYTFSTENWFRPLEEIDALMWLIETYLIEQKDKMIKEGIRLHTIGNSKQLPTSLQNTIKETKKATAHCSEVNLILAINYGGRDDITRALRSIINDCDKGKISKDDINEEIITRYLDTAKWRDPELLIRTSGEMRVSNFLNWQIAYTEIHSVACYWPDFTPHHLYQAVDQYQVRERRLGY